MEYGGKEEDVDRVWRDGGNSMSMRVEEEGEGEERRRRGDG